MLIQHRQMLFVNRVPWGSTSISAFASAPTSFAKRRSAEQLKEIFLNVTKPPPELEVVVKPKVQAAPSSFKKHSSFDQAVKVEVTGVRRENSLKRIKSSPVISQDRAGKEQIEGKRKEALAKRQEALAKRQEAEAKRQKVWS